MDILLVDIDSKIPNLALMKLSAYYKALGHNIGFDIVDPDIVYASVIFKKNKHLVDGLKFWYPHAQINIGGSGYNLSKTLPDEIESTKPDYDLYTDVCNLCGSVRRYCNCKKKRLFGKIDYSLGYSSRGCIRNCYFCIVPEKEGHFCRAVHPKEWYNPDFNKIMFLDNNILADKEWFFEITDWCIQKDLKVWFCQGLDIRLLDEQVSIRLKQLKLWKPIFFAWDHIEDEPVVREKLPILQKAGFDGWRLKRWIQFYVYVNSDADYNTGVYRCREIKKMGCNPFVMFNMDSEPTKRIKELKRWANKKQIFNSCDISEYSRAIA